MPRTILRSTFLTAILCSTLHAWTNGPSGNASTNQPEECGSIPYSTHDWVAEHALEMLPDEEKAWLLPHRAMYLLGTEAPDNDDIPQECGAPHSGYDDRRLGHSVEWSEDWSDLVNDRAAVRAQEEYDKAVTAYRAGDHAAAAFYLGAMAHYIGDVTQYGHSVPFENNHSNYESWVSRRTDSFEEGHFESYLELGRLVRRTPYTAVKWTSKATAGGRGHILWATRMDALYAEKDTSTAYVRSIGHSLNYGVNQLADVLHTFWLNEVTGR